MFVDDRPIQEKGEDRLSRSGFSSNLAASIIGWKGLESLVIALYGKWGSGKSSVINLAKADIRESTDKNKPTVIEFNPWLFSGDDKLQEHFFTEIASELSIRNAAEKDKELAEKIRAYQRLFGLLPDSGLLKQVLEKVLLAVGIAGVSAGQILQWLHIGTDTAKSVLIVTGIVLLALSLFSDLAGKIADLLEQQGKAKQKSATAFKEELKQALLKRNKKILLVLDDLDRLTPNEIRTVFRLIKANIDFPNVIYLLSFDRHVVEKALETQPGISGQDYLEKIVQVSFDIPLAKMERIEKLLFTELDRVLATLPKSSEKLFDQTYWGNVYHSGLRPLFRNLRDVKRFASSLEFNISMMYKGDSMEVHPVDFIAIEAIRVFAPRFYEFMRSRKSLFTEVDRETRREQNDSRKKEILDAFSLLPEGLPETVKGLLERIFPQVQGVLSVGYSTHGSDWLATWNKQLRVCSPTHFDTYFTLIPGGDESELSQFELDELLSQSSKVDFEKGLRDFMANGKIRKVLQRLEDYTSDTQRIPLEAREHLMAALFNVSDELSTERQGMFDFGSDMQVARIVYQLLKVNPNKEGNFGIYKRSIEDSVGVYGPVFCVSLEDRKDQKENEEAMVVPHEKVQELRNLCLERIKQHHDNGKLVGNPHVLSILYRWKEWDNSGKWKEFVDDLLKENDGMFRFLTLFVSTSYSHGMGDYVGRKRTYFEYKGLENFADSAAIKVRIEALKAQNDPVYTSHKDLADMFINNFGKAAGPLDD